MNRELTRREKILLLVLIVVVLVAGYCTFLFISNYSLLAICLAT